ncbi:MAG TPA: response regulator transcription factor [Terracidiphilus sp.]|jgi:DNA-binding NarL/FixJ family response regulator|nr:response regulator transcription factor [Terracidiphilus sp.]
MMRDDRCVYAPEPNMTPATPYNLLMPPIRILIVDDHPIMRIGITALIASSKEMEVVAQAASGEEALALHALHHPDITLMDLRLPGISGVETIRAIRGQSPKARFIVLTTYDGDEDIFQAMEAGAGGYLVKGMPQEMLVNAVKRVHAGGQYLPPPMSKVLASRMPDSSLSPRESEVLGLLAKGKSNREIANCLGISEATVKCHVSVILMRLDASDRTQAVVIALQRGLIHL